MNAPAPTRPAPTPPHGTPYLGAPPTGTRHLSTRRAGILGSQLAELLRRPGRLVTTGMSVLVAAYSGTIPATLVEMFKRSTRCTALSISYNAAFALLGGTAPLAAVYLVGDRHIDLGPALCLMASGAVSLAAALTLRDRTGRPLGP